MEKAPYIAKAEKRKVEYDKILRLFEDMRQTKCGRVGRDSIRECQSQSTRLLHEQDENIGAKVLLKSVFDSRKTIAIGHLQSIDPSKRIGQVQLGNHWYEIAISVAVEYDEDLVWPMSNMKTIGDSIGETVAWPKILVVVDGE